MKRQFLQKLILWTIFTPFILGMGGYVTTNFQSILAVSLGEVGVEYEEISETIEYIPQENTDFEYLEAIMEFPSSPVEFLEEILPNATPDPDQESATVYETLITGGTLISTFYVNDTSDSGTDLLEVLDMDLPFDTEITDEPMVLIYHTHTTESYMTGYTGFYYTSMTGRNTDSDSNVTVVGDAIAQVLEDAGISVIHDTEIYDSPEYTGAYSRSRVSVEEYLEQYPSIVITIDVHRDSMTTDSGTKYKPTTTIDGRDAAQIMILAGSDPTGSLGFDSWEENLIFALKLQEKAEELYPSLMRPLMFCQRKYNMDVTNASILIEVGTEVNTFAEAKYSGQLIANVIVEVLNDN